MSLKTTMLRFVDRVLPVGVADAHCDIPCGIYDPRDAIQAAETVVKMTSLIKDLEAKGLKTAEDHMQLARYTLVKEEHARKAKNDILIIWTDYFNPKRMAGHTDLHEQVWNACKLGSYVKSHADLAKANEFKAALEKIGAIFTAAKAAGL
ncbi:MAG: superoxide dismutase, Ni [Dehalococcoidia bacterium]|nr:superoxide dismutase, Ni [Dehalococcoidia bacterium]